MRRDSILSLAPALARRHARQASARPAAQAAPASGRIALGFAGEAEWLAGGLRADGLHEAFAASGADAPAALGFALLLAEVKRRQCPPAPPILWARQERSGMVPHAPGLGELGIDPGALALVVLPEPRAVLRAALDGLRAGAASVLIELAGDQPLLDLTASRRLAFAAGQSGALALIVRASARPGPSAAHSRWQVAAAPSARLAADAPGAPVFSLLLLRQRGGRDGLSLMLEWNRDSAVFREIGPSECSAPAGADPAAAPLSGAAPALAAGTAGGA